MRFYDFHINDYKSATAHLTNEEDLAYRRLLDTYYDTEASLPDDVNSLARKHRVSADAVSSILNEFFYLNNGYWHHIRADAEIAKWYERSDKAREKAKNGWEKRKKNSQSNATAMLQHSYSNADAMLPSTYDLVPSTKTPLTPQGGNVSEDGFDEFWEAYPKKQSRTQAASAWKKLSAKSKAEALADLPLRKRSVEWLKDNFKFVPYASKYLNKKLWLDECTALECEPSEIIEAYNEIIAPLSKEPVEPSAHNVNLIADLARVRAPLKRLEAWRGFFETAASQFRAANLETFRQKLRFDALVRPSRAEECANGTLFRFQGVAA